MYFVGSRGIIITARPDIPVERRGFCVLRENQQATGVNLPYFLIFEPTAAGDDGALRAQRGLRIRRTVKPRAEAVGTSELISPAPRFSRIVRDVRRRRGARRLARRAAASRCCCDARAEQALPSTCSAHCVDVYLIGSVRRRRARAVMPNAYRPPSG